MRTRADGFTASQDLGPRNGGVCIPSPLKILTNNSHSVAKLSSFSLSSGIRTVRSLSGDHSLFPYLCKTGRANSSQGTLKSELGVSFSRMPFCWCLFVEHHKNNRSHFGGPTLKRDTPNSPGPVLDKVFLQVLFKAHHTSRSVLHKWSFCRPERPFFTC